MIELYDRDRLLPRRDHTLWAAGGILILGVALMALRGWSLQHQSQQLRADNQRLQAQGDRLGKAAAAARQAPSPTLLADLRRTAERMEAETTPAGGATAGMAPSQWLAQLASLSNGDIGIVKAEIGRNGAATFEGQARSSAALSDYLQAWERHADLGRMPTRALEVREDTEDPRLLRFTLRTGAAVRPAAPRRAETAP